MTNCVCRAVGIASVFWGKLEQYIRGVKYFIVECKILYDDGGKWIYSRFG